MNCEHKNFHIRLDSLIGCAHCDDCGEQYHIAELINALIDRTQHALKEAERIVRQLGK
jgi:hypothetical protein